MVLTSLAKATLIRHHCNGNIVQGVCSSYRKLQLERECSTGSLSERLRNLWCLNFDWGTNEVTSACQGRCQLETSGAVSLPPRKHPIEGFKSQRGCICVYHCFCYWSIEACSDYALRSGVLVSIHHWYAKLWNQIPLMISWFHGCFY